MLLAIFVSILLLGFGEVKLRRIYSAQDRRPMCPCGIWYDRIAPRVIGGRNAGRGLFPYSSYFLLKDGMKEHERRSSKYEHPFCGATLISDRHLITAAHCFDNTTLIFSTLDEFLVVIGDYDLQMDRNYIRQIKTIVMAPYDPWKLENDIAVVELDKPVNLKRKVRAAVLPNPGLELEPGTNVVVYGWGTTTDDVTDDVRLPSVLQLLEMPVVGKEKCGRSLRRHLPSSMLCAGGEAGRDACVGDSGSGLILPTEQDFVLCGVVSFGHACAIPDLPGIYTRVSSYIDWIYKNTMSSDCKPCIYKGGPV